MKIMPDFIRCPICGGKTRVRIIENTELKNFPLYCPKCKQESLINVKKLRLTVTNELGVRQTALRRIENEQ